MKPKFKFLVVAVFVLSCIVGINANAERHAKSSSPSAVTQNEPVNINQADANALMKLKGIGPKKAEAIITYRKENGPFKSVDDLAKVKGFGQKRVTRLVQENPDRIVVR